MLSDILLASWLFLPTATANMTPILAAKVPGLAKLNTPIDGGASFRGKRVLGANKTWRGLVSGIIAATLTFWLQQYLAGHTAFFIEFTAEINYATLPALVLGPLFAVGALGGDAVKSFIKRQLNAPAGHPWPFFDQVGEILGSILITMPFVMLSFSQYAWVIVIWVVGDLLVSTGGYLLGIKERPI